MTQDELCKYGQDPKSCTSNPMDCQCAIDASLAQTQEPPPWWPAVENILTEYGLQAIDFVADFKQALAQKREPIAMLFGSLPVYDDTTPPQRTWVGLTDEEIDKLRSGYQSGRIGSFVALAQAIEAKLKEKNI